MRRTSSETKREKKKGTAPKKQFHASVGTKRRPGMPRRISSQSSASSEAGVKDDGSKGSKQQGQRRSIEEAGETAALGKPPGSKAAGKRPAARPGLERRVSHEASRKTASNQQAGLVPQTRSLEDVRRQHPPTAQENSDLSNGPTVAKPERTQSFEPLSTGPKARPSAPRSQTHAEPSTSKAARPVLAAEPTASTTNVAARGTIIDFDRAPSAYAMETVPETEDVSVPRQQSTTSLLEPKFAPTQPSAAPAVPLGRTRSQLTLLLEKEKERLGEKPRG